jgi:hypothetical protein
VLRALADPSTFLRRATAILFVAALSVLRTGVARAAPETLSATMSGAQETPPNTSVARGTCSATVDPTMLQVSFAGNFSGLVTPATAVTLRGLANAGVTAPALLSASSFTASLSGTFTGSGTLAPEQVAGMTAGETYCEVDDATFPSGEIRGQLTLPVPTPAVPEWGVACLAALLGCAGVGSRRCRAPWRARRGA